MDALLQVQLEVDTEEDLGEHMEEDPVAEVSVDVVGAELPALVHMAESIAEESENGAEGLDRDVPSTFGNLQRAQGRPD